MSIKTVLAVVMTVAIVAWMATGTLVISGSAQEAETRPPAERASADRSAFRVRARTISAVERQRTLTMRGRTRADALVEVASETTGRIDERPVDRGTRVAVGDILCRLDEGVRAAQLDQAEAEAASAKLDFNAATKLQGRGFESETRVAATRAALDAAQATVATARQELARTIVRAPIAGVVQEPLANVGATLPVGGVCATIVDADPIIVTGQVSERNIRDIEHGAVADIDLVTGDSVSGTVGYVSRTADPDTRTFTVELTVPNEDNELRDGVTAEARIPLSAVNAHRLSPGVLTLSDAGQVGVRVVEDGDKAAFIPVTIAMQDTEGLWVTGLPETVTLITVGQDYVVDGQVVDPVMEDEGA